MPTALPPLTDHFAALPLAIHPCAAHPLSAPSPPWLSSPAPFTRGRCNLPLTWIAVRIKRADHKPFAKTISQECRRLVHLLLVPDVSQRQAASDAAAGWLKLRGIAA